MAIPDFSTLVLSEQQLEDLRMLLHESVKSTDAWPKRLTPLCDLGLVKSNVNTSVFPSPGWIYSITETGKQYLRYLDRRKSEMHFANTMSVLAFSVSAIALIVSIVSAYFQWIPKGS